MNDQLMNGTATGIAVSPSEISPSGIESTEGQLAQPYGDCDEEYMSPMKRWVERVAMGVAIIGAVVAIGLFVGIVRPY